MTSPRTHAALPIARIEDAELHLHAAGMRVSFARRRLLELLLAAERPLRADEIAAALGDYGDLPSVYRNLEAFEQLGIVQHVHLGHAPGLYALAGERTVEYLVCERCDDVRVVEPATLDAVRDEIRRAHGFEARFDHFPLTGLCTRCSDELEDHRASS